MTFGKLDFVGETWVVDALKPHVSIRFKDVFKGIEFGSRPPFLLRDRMDRAFDLDWFMSRYPLDVTDRAAARIADGVMAHFACGWMKNGIETGSLLLGSGR